MLFISPVVPQSAENFWSHQVVCDSNNPIIEKAYELSFISVHGCENGWVWPGIVIFSPRPSQKPTEWLRSSIQPCNDVCKKITSDTFLLLRAEFWTQETLFLKNLYVERRLYNVNAAWLKSQLYKRCAYLNQPKKLQESYTKWRMLYYKMLC